jgi:phosphatidylglycerophosphate synthase
MLGRIRKELKPLLIKIAKVISIIPLTADQFTFLAIPLGGVAAYFLATENYLYGLIFVVVSIVMDLLDGSFAIAKGQKSFFGNYLDAIVDKIVEALIYLGFAFNYPLLAFICFSTTMLNSYAKPRVALVIETDNHDWPAIGDRADRLLLLIIGLLLANLIKIKDIDVVQITLGIIAIVTLIGFTQRIIYANKLIKKAEKEGKILPYLKDQEQSR